MNDAEELFSWEDNSATASREAVFVLIVAFGRSFLQLRKNAVGALGSNALQDGRWENLPPALVCAMQLGRTISAAGKYIAIATVVADATNSRRGVKPKLTIHDGS